METVLIVIHLMVVIALVGTILLQKSEGGALGMGGGGGGGGFMTGRGAASALTRATAILATVFFLTSIALTILHRNSGDAPSILDAGSPSAPASSDAPAAPAVPAPGGGSLLDQLGQPQTTGPQVPQSQ